MAFFDGLRGRRFLGMGQQYTVWMVNAGGEASSMSRDSMRRVNLPITACYRAMTTSRALREGVSGPTSVSAGFRPMRPSKSEQLPVIDMLRGT